MSEMVFTLQLLFSEELKGDTVHLIQLGGPTFACSTPRPNPTQLNSNNRTKPDKLKQPQLELQQAKNMDYLRSTLLRRKRKEHKRSLLMSHYDSTFSEKYIVTEDVIDSGSFATVVRGYSKATSEPLAIKVISRKGMGVAAKRFLSNEIEALTRLEHEQVLHFVTSTVKPGKVYLVTELCHGGNLLYKVAELGHLPEKVCVEIVHSLARALTFCHDNGVVHRDLKPENIFLKYKVTDPTDFSWVAGLKIGDFGCSAVKDLGPEEDATWRLRTVCGSMGYMAPEVVLNKRYGTPCDFWGLGMILFICASGQHPFITDASTQIALSKKITQGSFHLPTEIWDTVSDKMSTLVFSLLKLQPEERMNFQEAIQYIHQRDMI